MRTRIVEYALLFTVLMVFGTTAYGFLSGQAAREWEARAKMELKRAEVAREKTQELLALFATVEERGDSLATEASLLGVRVKERVADVRERAAPDPVPPVVVRDQIIDELLVVVDTWEEAYNEQVRASEVLQVAYGLQSITLDSLTAVLEDRPTPRPRWLPSVSPGLFVGVCNDGRGCMGVGVTLSWSLQ